MLAEPVTAERALSLGLVTSVVDDDELAAAAQELAARLAAGPTAAYGAIKEGLAVRGHARPRRGAGEGSRAAGCAGADRRTTRAATLAFVRKEQPVYQGR